MKLYSYLTTKNETGRYLEECLEELMPYVDGLVIWDDQSTDGVGMRQLATKYGAVLFTRPTECFSFVEDESAFREDAWTAMAVQFQPTEDDWILSIDADEFLRTPYPEYLKELCEALGREGYNGLQFHIHEVWTDITEAPEIRTDGFWAQTEGLRACRYQPNPKFKEAKLGGGSLPSYVDNVVDNVTMDILHYGYAREEDRQKKYQRYRAHMGKHNPRHISSILQTPTLAPLPPLVYDA